MSNYEKEQAIFIERFNQNSLDNGISSVVKITTDENEGPVYIHEKYVPKGYIKVCERSTGSFTHKNHDTIFIKEMDAKGGIVTIKIHDLYKGLVIGKRGENIRNIARMINASSINVI